MLAANAKLRPKVVAKAPSVTGHAYDHVCAQHVPVHMSCARLVKRVFAVRYRALPVRRQCKAHRDPFNRLRTGIAAPAVIAKILTHLGIKAQPPPIAPAWRVWLFEAA